MAHPVFGEWQDMASAPKDGTKVLAQLRASEQGAAEVDMVRWAKPERSAEPCWISADSDPAAPVVYAEIELICWMPMPAPLPKLGATRITPARKPARTDEMGGSGI